MLSPKDVVSYREMCDLYGVSLQRGMNFRIIQILCSRHNLQKKDNIQ